VVVMNTPFGNSITTAEHAISMMMSLARKIPQANASTHAGKWEKSKFMGSELYCKTLGLIGCGNIGSIVADRAQGLKMKVIAYDPYLSADKADSLNIEKVELDELLSRADYITLHTPLNDATRGILGKENLAKTKQGVGIINCARGGLIDEAALKDAIESGHVGGAALDVFEVEPATDNALFGLEQVICTPHLGASTSEAQENVAIQVAEQMAAYLTSGAVTNALNIPSVSAEDAKKLKPYLNLVELLGSFTGQITETGLKSITIEYEGDVGKLNTKPMTAVALQGVLSPLVDSVNMVNAPVIAQERGIKVSETTREQTGDYKNLIRVITQSEQRTREVVGTLFGGEPRIVSVNDVKVEASAASYIIFVNNEDKPGLIGDLGQLLGKAAINIANFHLGRGPKSDDAIALVEVDQPVDEALITEIAKLPSVKQAKFLQF
jgi:D-3-phosphoglycerate dehydrogenase